MLSDYLQKGNFFWLGSAAVPHQHNIKILLFLCPHKLTKGK